MNFDLILDGPAMALLSSGGHRWGAVIFLPDEEGPCDPRRLVGKRNRHESGRLLCEKLVDPDCTDRAFVARISHDRSRADNEQRAKVSITHFGDTAEPLLTSAGVLFGCEPQPGGKLTAGLEVRRVRDRRRDGRCRDEAYAWDRFQPFARRARSVPGKQFDLDRPDPRLKIIQLRHAFPVEIVDGVYDASYDRKR